MDAKDGRFSTVLAERRAAKERASKSVIEGRRLGAEWEADRARQAAEKARQGPSAVAPNPLAPDRGSAMLAVGPGDTGFVYGSDDPTAALNDIKATGETEIWRSIYALETGQALLHARASRVLWAPYVACFVPTGTRVAVTARSSAGNAWDWIMVTVLDGPYQGCRGATTVKLLFPRSP